MHTDLPYHIPGYNPAPEDRPHLDLFLLTIFQEGKQLSTIRAYGWHLNKLSQWLHNETEHNMITATEYDLLSWGAYLRMTYSEATQKQGISAARTFYRWLHDKEIITKNIGRVLHTPKVRVSMQRTLTRDEITRLIQVCPEETPIGKRDQALIAILVDAGLRASEVCNLDRKDLSTARHSLLVHSKGGNTDQIFLSNFCIAYLEKWLAVRPEADTDALFISIGGTRPHTRLTPRGLRIILRKRGKQANVPDVHPHAFRRSFATLRLKAGQPSRIVQILGRWKNLTTFERYSQALLGDSAFWKEAMIQYSPLKEITTDDFDRK
ncbi:hypothetical protein D6779_07330 [Candidatus Parcubacteria bacterium]|nr:MAG: hypothetical protein D6779_07330 [Candidatus Parcubacteria bacterium]